MSEFNWKVGNEDTQIINEKIPSNMRPPINGSTHQVQPNYNDPNSFKARPIKHWRKQNINTTPANVGGSTINNNLLQYYTSPGGTIITPSINKDNDCLCSNNLLTPSYEVAYRNKMTINNKVGRFYPNSFADQTNYVNPCNNFDLGINNYNICIGVCDPAKKARASVRYPSAVNTNKTKPTYYQSSSSYLQSRCKLFNQNQFNYLKKSSCYNNKIKPGPLTAKCYEFYGNCPQSCKTGSCKCNKVNYKPNNPTFSQQGAVSSSTRLERLKLNTLKNCDNACTNKL